MNGVVVQVSVDGSAPAKGLATGICGNLLDVSVLSAAAERLGEPGRLRARSRATVVFHSSRYGDSPVVDGVVKAANRSDGGARLTIEISDWQALASFWREALGR